LLHRLGRRVAVVEADQVDLAPVDPALGIDLLEVADLALAERRERRHRTRVGHGLADLDLARADAGRWPTGRRGLGKRTDGARHRRNSHRGRARQNPTVDHPPPPPDISRSLACQRYHGAPRSLNATTAVASLHGPAWAIESNISASA